MLFNSVIFLVFAAVFFAIWPFARRIRNLRFLYLITASFVFYGWWDWRFLFLIIASGLMDYCAGLGMQARPQHKRAFLFLSLFGNIGSLMVFKYSGFFADNLSLLLTLFGQDIELRSSLPHFVLILPVGISFYTFQSMSYTIDIYRGKLEPTHNILHFFAYLALFPQLVAGPIIRATDLLPQLNKETTTSESQRWEGLRLICHGFFKKMVIADTLAYYVTGAFDGSLHGDSCLFWWIIITAFAVQIYCDFSGYSDIARGLACWMGYRFMENFNHPYIATSLQEFWTRWHISLSTWFRDYVYIPLGGSRSGRIRSEANMWITMLISGLWHGAAWNFVVWGGLHAFGVTIERFTRWPARIKQIPGGRFFASMILLVQVWVTWVFFRAHDFPQALHILGRMFSFRGGLESVRYELGGVELLNISLIVGVVVLREAYFFLHLNERRILPARFHVFTEVVAMALLIVACVFFRGVGSQFIYFQF